MKESYGSPPKFHSASLKIIELCDTLVTEYAEANYRLTIRQLYYRLVAGGHIENTRRSYDNIVALLTNARLAGLIDWDTIEDRTREFLTRSHWNSGSEILNSVARQYYQDMWEEQDYRVFCVVEKEALAGVLERPCRLYDVPLLPARGYPSATSLREFAKDRIIGADNVVILHFGDHDPSGMDMSRDLQERLELFTRGYSNIDFQRIALNMDQIEEQKPPPNPAKITDSRYDEYRRQYGEESWELDALAPQYLDELVTTNIQRYIDTEIWDKTEAEIDRVRSKLQVLANNFDNEE